MAALRLCRTTNFSGGKPWQKALPAQGESGLCQPHRTASRGSCHVLFPSQLQPAVAVLGIPGVLCWISTAMKMLHLPSTFIQSSRRINVMEEVEEQRPQNNTLGSFTLRRFSHSCAQQSPNKSTNGVFILFWIGEGIGEKALWMQKKAGTRKGRDSTSLGGTFRCGHEGPRCPQQQPKLCSPKVLHFLLLLAHTSQNTPWDLPAQGRSWNHPLNKALEECDKCWQTLKCFSPEWLGGPFQPQLFSSPPEFNKSRWEKLQFPLQSSSWQNQSIQGHILFP